jgi:hypothetical protein
MKGVWYALAVAMFGVISAGAFVGDQMTKSIGDLGSELVQAVSLTGEVLGGHCKT